ncbi:MAG TPA: hypothetical protein VI524_15285, partial [Anaerolineales bacterium]|nr:hypothetical protein [Anaerolineales bacterium]
MTEVITTSNPSGSDVGEVDFIICPTISHDRWLSAICGFDDYLSSRCLIGRDYTLPEKGVK